VALVLPATNEAALFSWHSIAADAALKFVANVFWAGLALLAWRIVGGRASTRSFMAAYAYLFAAGLLIFALLTSIDAGALRLVKPNLFAEIIASSSSGQDSRRLKILLGSEGTYAMKALLDSDKDMADVIQTPGFLWIASMAVLRGVFTLAWLMVSWGAFRKILQMPQSRAVFSLAIFLAFGLIITLSAGFFQMAPIVVDPNRWLEHWPLLKRWVDRIIV